MYTYQINQHQQLAITLTCSHVCFGLALHPSFIIFTSQILQLMSSSFLISILLILSNFVTLPTHLKDFIFMACILFFCLSVSTHDSHPYVSTNLYMALNTSFSCAHYCSKILKFYHWFYVYVVQNYIGFFIFSSSLFLFITLPSSSANRYYFLLLALLPQQIFPPICLIFIFLHFSVHFFYYFIHKDHKKQLRGPPCLNPFIIVEVSNLMLQRIVLILFLY